ncbi:hypothetical protein CFOL_v3_23437 [Cephalotus follicularis]|uniref:Uncharacterized protein n=1 Tax=Cephalotus follicularis TaxID=3775 RepID=A0A1Q3CIC5_CEPFO|nr:hypothetical protein CFOL_v3_23437 [Cephalotus follicularis]
MLQAQSWGFIIGFLVWCLEAGVTATVGLFKEFHTITSSPKKRGFYFKSRAGHHRLLAENNRMVKSWREKYFMVKNLPDFTPSSWSDTLDTATLSQRVFLTREERVNLDKLLALSPEEVLDVVSEVRLRSHGLSIPLGRRDSPGPAREIPVGIRKKKGRKDRHEPEPSNFVQGESRIMLPLGFLFLTFILCF